MDFLRPTTLAEALRAKADIPDAVPIAGGTDVMVELNFDKRRPTALLDLNQVPELATWTEDDETVQPPDSARLDGAVNVPIQSICPQSRVAHSGLPTDPAVTALVINALGTARLNAPTECPQSG